MPTCAARRGGVARTWRVGTRRSALALVQARAVAEWLRARAGDAVELVEVTTTGDRLREQNPAAGGGRGVFVKQLDAALLDGRVDLCVHSAKDVPPEIPEGLCIAAFPARGDPRDALVAPCGWTLASMPEGARVGTGSPRRALQLLRRRPDVRVLPLRGNVDSRLARQAAGDFDALVLAAAGLERLGAAGAAAERIDSEVMVPAAGQGALAVETRADAAGLLALLAPLDDLPTAAAVLAERAVLAALGGGCSAPAGALAVAGVGTLRLTAMLGGIRSGRVRQVALACPLDSGTWGERSWLRAAAEALGRRAAAGLLAGGGEVLLREAGGWDG